MLGNTPDNLTLEIIWPNRDLITDIKQNNAN